MKLETNSAKYQRRLLDASVAEQYEAQDEFILPVEMDLTTAAIFGGNYCAAALGPSRCWLVWDKRVETTPDNQSDCELVWTNFDLPCRIYRHLWRGIIRAGEENVSISPKLHPHQKPLGLLRWIISYSGITRGPVLDPYCGSGSTLLAALQLGLPAIGIEIEERYCEIAANRLRQGVLGLSDSLNESNPLQQTTGDGRTS